MDHEDDNGGRNLPRNRSDSYPTAELNTGKTTAPTRRSDDAAQYDFIPKPGSPLKFTLNLKEKNFQTADAPLGNPVAVRTGKTAARPHPSDDGAQKAVKTGKTTTRLYPSEDGLQKAKKARKLDSSPNVKITRGDSKPDDAAEGFVGLQNAKSCGKSTGDSLKEVLDNPKAVITGKTAARLPPSDDGGQKAVKTGKTTGMEPQKAGKARKARKLDSSPNVKITSRDSKLDDAAEEFVVLQNAKYCGSQDSSRPNIFTKNKIGTFIISQSVDIKVQKGKKRRTKKTLRNKMVQKGKKRRTKKTLRNKMVKWISRIVCLK